MRNGWALIIVSSVFLGCRTTGPVRSAPDSPTSEHPSGAGAASSSVPPPAREPAFKVFSVYTEKGSRLGHYTPTGYMGDSDVVMSGAYLPTPHGHGPCLRINYKASGPKGWAGVSWQDPPNNWASVPGRAGYDLRGATRLTFWARGERGGERVQEFRMGGIVGSYPDSDVATLNHVRLTKEWKQYTIDLSGKDLRHIISGFGFSVLKAENSGGMQFYIDDIFYEGAEGMPEPAAASTATVQSPLPTATTAAVTVPAAAPLLMPPAVATQDLDIKEVASGLKVSFSSRLRFLPGQAVLEPASHKTLDQLNTLLSAYPTNRVLIEGHTDNTGDKHFNLRLSELRAKEVRDYLIKKGGYEASRFQVIGYGDTKPMASNSQKLGRSLNRRVEVTILKSVK